ncbi:hypothetical protein TNCV_635601 [Trichonephila clavipes]|nr:hypothetical protein TNCV_635601 [Trichonephila clavipes]
MAIHKAERIGTEPMKVSRDARKFLVALVPYAKVGPYTNVGSTYDHLNYTRAFGDGPRHFEPRPSDKNDTCVGTPSPNYLTNERMFELSTDLTCIASLHGVAAVAEWYRYRNMACLVTSSSPVPLKTRRVGQRCT